MKHNIIRTRLITATIANGTATSVAYNIEEEVPVAIVFPSSMTGTGLTFQTSWDNSTFYVPYGSAADLTVTKQNSKMVAIDAAYRDYFGSYIKIASSGNEGADRTFYIVVRPRT